MNPKKLHTQDSFNTPILFLIFNRPDVTEKVFGQIRKVQPKQLFIAADGPRDSHPEDKEKCSVTREKVLNMIDWDCEVKTLFRDENLGCGHAVSQAITWFFEHVEMGIILEDDCYPDLSFFFFCSKLLFKYERDDRIMQICGSNYLDKNTDIEESYYFSNYGPIWGWATWKRFWNYYDFDISDWPIFKRRMYHYSIAKDENEALHREKLFDEIYNKTLDTWDFQVVYARMFNNGLAIIPSKNLITNIGFGIDATHTTRYDERSTLSLYQLDLPLKHPRNIIPDYKADLEYRTKYLINKKNKSIIKRIFKC